MRILKRTTSLLASLATLALALPVTEARADLVLAGPPTITPSPVPQDGGGYIWSYTIITSPGEQLNPEDSFTIYDFGPGHVFFPGGNFVVSTDPFAPTTVVSSSGLITPMQTAALNWTFTWGDIDPRGPFTIIVSLWSASNTPQMAAFVGNASNSTPIGCQPPIRDWRDCTWLKEANLTTTLVPTTTPEPTTVVLLGSGMLVIAGATWRRRKRSA